MYVTTVHLTMAVEAHHTPSRSDDGWYTLLALGFVDQIYTYTIPDIIHVD